VSKTGRAEWKSARPRIARFWEDWTQAAAEPPSRLPLEPDVAEEEQP